MSNSDFVVSAGSLVSANSNKPATCPGCQDNAPSFADLLGRFEEAGTIAPSPDQSLPDNAEPGAAISSSAITTINDNRSASQISSLEELAMFQQLQDDPVHSSFAKTHVFAPDLLDPSARIDHPASQLAPLRGEAGADQKAATDVRPVKSDDRATLPPANAPQAVQASQIRTEPVSAPVNQQSAPTDEQPMPAINASSPVAANDAGLPKSAEAALPSSRDQLPSRAVDPAQGTENTENTAAHQNKMASNDNARPVVNPVTATAQTIIEGRAERIAESTLAPTIINPAAAKPTATEIQQSQAGVLPVQERATPSSASNQNAAQNGSPNREQEAKTQSTAPLSQAFDNLIPKAQSAPDLTTYSAMTGLATDMGHSANMGRPANIEISNPVSQTNAQTAPQIPLNNLAAHITARSQAGFQRFEVRLDPPELGRIDIKIDIGRDGQTLTHLTVEKPETLDLLRQDVRQLERALTNAGLDSRDGNLSFSLRDENGNKKQAGEAEQDEATPAPELLNEADESEQATISQTVTISSGIDVKV